MTYLTYQTGDLFTAQTQAIGHGVNVDGVMGHGIAPLFKKRLPDMYAEYKNLCDWGHLLPGECYLYSTDAPKGFPWEKLYVANIASQDRPGRNAKLEWLDSGVRNALQMLDNHGVKQLALPRIGAGIGGLEWADVRRTLEYAAHDFECDIEVWTLPDH